MAPQDFIYPDAEIPENVGKYPASSQAGGGYVWDEVLEYRVRCFPRNGAADIADGCDYYYAFVTFLEAKAFAEATTGPNNPLALVLQQEHIEELREGDYRHIREKRITEWPVAFLRRPKRTPNTIPDFLTVDAPVNRLAILRGE
ncbi:hypothetical protein [Marinibacterium sp. SX1]|uniref:hypothetical protein n=1 Tax=Marinibacterium sp. SX1 TaxID=3388424 RepID=UPI003D16E64C